MKAIVISDQYDDQKIKDDLFMDLSKRGIIIREYASLDALEKSLPFLQQKETYLYFHNVYVRYPNLDQILDLNKNNSFDYIKTDQSILSFKPESVVIGRDGPYSPAALNKKLFFKLSPDWRVVTHNKPSHLETPLIILYTHNRETYLRLTLNSLLYSTEDCPEVKIAVFLNDPTLDVFRTALEYMARSPRIEVLKVEKNIAFSATNVAIQWYKPNYLIVAEDDFVLPEAVRKNYPYWPYQFVCRQEFCDYLAWKTTFLNVPFNNGQEWVGTPTNKRSGWNYHTREKVPHVMAQLFGVRSSFWRDLYKEDIRTVTDQIMLLNSKKVGIPNMEGYHVGWGQVQDGYFNLQKWLQGFKMPHESTKVKNIRTGEERKIVLKDIKQCYLR